jgi:hypothetical protein
MIRHRALIPYASPYAQSHGSGRRSASGVPLGFRVLLINIKPYTRRTSVECVHDSVRR